MCVFNQRQFVSSQLFLYFHLRPKPKDTVAPCSRGSHVHQSVGCEGAGGAGRSTELRSSPRCRHLCENNVLAEQQIGVFF